MPSDAEARLTVAIIGAGPLGRWLALSAAKAGFNVLLEDVMPSNMLHAQEYIRQQLGPEFMGAGTESPVTFVSTIEDAVRKADLIIDCIPDELESKLEILWLLDRMAPPRAIFNTPTLNLSITDLANCTYRAGQCIAIAASPTSLGGIDAKVGSAIALKAGPATTPDTIALVSSFWSSLGFLPTVEHAAAI